MRALVGILTLMLVGLAGCSPADSDEDLPEGARIALVMADLSLGDSVQLVEAATRRAAELGMEVEPFDGDPDRQKDLVSQAVAEGYDAILVQPADTAGYEGVFLAAQEADVPLAVLDRQTSAMDVSLTYVGSDPEAQGRVQMQGVVDALGGEGRIAIVSHTMRTSPQVSTQLGYDAVLGEHPGIEVVFSQPANGRLSEAARLVEGWLGADDSLDAVVAMDDTMALGALEASQEAGRDDLAVFGIGASDGALSALLRGDFGGTVWRDPAEVGRAAADVIGELIRDPRRSPETFTGKPEWVDQGNVNEYLYE